MAIFKKSIIIILCMILAFSPLLYCGDFSYADDSWHDITDLSGDDYKKYIVGGIKAGLNYFGYKETFSYDIAKAIWTYNYSQWDRIAKAGGYSGVEELNTKIKYRIDSDYKLHFKVTMSGLQFINDLLHELVDYYDLTQGYTKEIYSGKYFEDDNGIGCYVFVITDQTSSYSTDRPILDFNSNVYWGTPYRFSGKAYYDTNNDGMNTYTINYSDKSYPYHMKCYKTPETSDVVGFSLNDGWPLPSGKNGYIYLGPDNRTSYQSVNGWVCITTNQSFNRYYLGTFLEYYSKNSPTSVYCQLYSEQLLSSIQVNNQSVRGNYTPNNNTADGDKDINTGDGNVDDFLENDDPQIVVDDDNGLPDTPPTDPYVPNDTGGNVDPQDGDVNWHMPDINVDWDLGDFTHIFPFSIPYDIIELFDIVDAEPVTPAIYQEVDFGAFNYTIDFDLSYFDEFMEYVRAMELFLYTLTLFIATRGIFKIY